MIAVNIVDEKTQCFFCGCCYPATAWADNGFVCPFCDRWYNADLHALARSKWITPPAQP